MQKKKTKVSGLQQQNDWYTGIDHYYSYQEKEINIAERTISEPTHSVFHNLVELYYVFSGKGTLEINGADYPAEGGALFCLYAHHFYRFKEILEPLKVIVVQFHIGLFMYMSWEKHPQNANAKLVYDTKPVVYTEGKQRGRMERLVEELLLEEKEERFECKNMIAYKTLELHAYFCRYAFEEIGKPGVSGGEEADIVWRVIPRLLLAASRTPVQEEAAEHCGCSVAALNRRLKDASGYTFHQLVQLGKILNACALLHFPELTLDYISDILEFSTKQSFYRTFSQYCHMTPREYQQYLNGEAPEFTRASGTALRFLQYMHQHFYESLTVETLAGTFCMKPYTVKNIFETVFGMPFYELLGQIRVCYACAFLRATRQNILGIATLCGFESISTFQRTFEQWMHQTPGEYRKSFEKIDNKT